MPSKSKIVLPKRYYLKHFNEMLDSVLKSNGDLIGETELDFVECFRAAAVEDQCLFVRMANRKGVIFRTEHLVYEEIPDLQGSICRLKQINLLRDTGRDDWGAMLNRLTVEELKSLVETKTQSNKRSLVAHLSEEDHYDRLRNQLPEMIALGSEESLAFLLFLYFGRIEEGVTAFALRDLGVIKTRGKQVQYQSRFESREIATTAFFYQRLHRRIREASEHELTNLSEQVVDWPVATDIEIAAIRHRCVYKLGRSLERAGKKQEALVVHLQSDQFPATERSTRLLYQSGDRDGAELYLKRLIENPSSDGELIFAEDFYQRKFGERKVGRLTEVLRTAKVLSLDETGREYPEAAAVAWYERSGASAWHVENVIWTQLFGILFWDRLFEGADAAIHGEFDRMPSGLRSGKFYQQNREWIEQQLDRLNDSDWISGQVAKVNTCLEANPNFLLFEDPKLDTLVIELVRLSPPGSVACVMRELAEDFRDNRSGFPDLLVLENDTVRLVEVKAEGDQIQRHQLAQMERLRRAGFVVEVSRIKWAVDPEQVYVVVDVETTGGNASWNRVTEIGAVKICGGQVIAEWSSLINPERKIPKNIVSLTGITDEMVADAPLFAEVANEFREFLGNAVFVGHRVAFDFGFIKQEFSRIEETLRMPTMCTVVEMRKHLPGQASYSLANLCESFNVDLGNHHRALCDAKATAELLVMINQKRVEKSLMVKG